MVNERRRLSLMLTMVAGLLLAGCESFGPFPVRCVLDVAYEDGTLPEGKVHVRAVWFEDAEATLAAPSDPMRAELVRLLPQGDRAGYGWVDAGGSGGVVFDIGNGHPYGWPVINYEFYRDITFRRRSPEGIWLEFSPAPSWTAADPQWRVRPQCFLILSGEEGPVVVRVAHRGGGLDSTAAGGEGSPMPVMESDPVPDQSPSALETWRIPIRLQRGAAEARP